MKLIQENIESLIVEEVDLVSDIEKEASFHEQVRKCRVKVKRVLSNDTESSSLGKQRAQVNLSKLNLPIFTGEYIKWIEFRDLFEVSVNSRDDLLNVAKFSYFLHLLKGEAAACISGLSVTDWNYHSAWTMLCDRYDRPGRAKRAHLKALLNVQPHLPLQSRLDNSLTK